MNGDATTPSWYYAKAGAVDGQQVGPVSWEQLVSLAQTGALTGSDLVWNPQFPSWVTVSEVPGLLAPPLPPAKDTSQETSPPALGQTAPRPGAIQPTAARTGAIQPAPRQPSRPSTGYDPFLDEGEPADFGMQRPWLRWGMAIGAVVVIGIILGVYFGVIRGGTEPTTTLAPTTTVVETTTTTEVEIPVLEAIWTDLAPSGDLPSARSEHAVAYDATDNLMVLFGGWDSTDTTFDDTWLFDSLLNTWTEADITGTVPAARAQHQMAYDPVNGKVILFGGISEADGTQFDDTWAYDPAAKTWEELEPSGSPSARSSFSMVYDDADQKIILFGGWSEETGADLDDTWAYDPTDNTWTELQPTGTVPTARGGHSMAYDQVESRVVLFGGIDSQASTYFNDTYLYDFATNVWTQVIPMGDTPTLRAGHRMTYDPSSGTVVLFGGWDGTAYYDDTWTFSVATETWTDLGLMNAPSARDSHSLVYSISTNELILFGGYVGGTDVAQDTWSFGASAEFTTDDTLPLTEDTEALDDTTTTVGP